MCCLLTALCTHILNLHSHPQPTSASWRKPPHNSQQHDSSTGGPITNARSSSYLVDVAILGCERGAGGLRVCHVAVALAVVILYKHQGAARGQVPAGQVLAAQECQVTRHKAVKHQLRPAELNDLYNATKPLGVGQLSRARTCRQKAVQDSCPQQSKHLQADTPGAKVECWAHKLREYLPQAGIFLSSHELIAALQHLLVHIQAAVHSLHSILGSACAVMYIPKLK